MERLLVIVLHLCLLLVAVDGRMSVRERVKFLEVQVSHESAKTGTDLRGLRSDLEALNSTIYTRECSADYGDITSELKPGTGLEKELQQLVTSQKQTAGAIKMAFGKQKRRQEREFENQNEKLNKLTENVSSLTESLNKFRTDIDDTKALLAPALTGIKSRLTKLEQDIEDVASHMKSPETKIGTQAAYVSCEPPWVKIAGACYSNRKFRTHEREKTYDEAQKECKKIGGRIAEPNTYNKMLQTINTFQSASHSHFNYLIGVLRNAAGKFEWASNRDPFITSFWHADEPNNLNGQENCVVIVQGYLNDISCENAPGSQYGYICEKVTKTTITTTTTTTTMAPTLQCCCDFYVLSSEEREDGGSFGRRRRAIDDNYCDPDPECSTCGPYMYYDYGGY